MSSITACTFVCFRELSWRMLKLLKSRLGRLDQLHILRQNRKLHHGLAQDNLPRLTYEIEKSQSSNIYYENSPDKSLYLDAHRLVKSFSKNVSGLLKEIPVKRMLKRFSSYTDQLKLGWQEDSEKVK